MNILSSPIWPSDMPDERRVIALLGLVQISEEGMNKFNVHINNALLLIGSALEQIESGFVRCDTCGDQEDTKDLDFVAEIKDARNELLIEARNSSNDAEIERLNALVAMQAEALNKLLGINSHVSLYETIEELRQVDFDTAETVSAWQSKRDEKVKRDFSTWLCTQTCVQTAVLQYMASELRAKGEYA